MEKQENVNEVKQEQPPETNVHGQVNDYSRSYSPNHYHNQNPQAAARHAQRAQNFYSF